MKLIDVKPAVINYMKEHKCDVTEAAEVVKKQYENLKFPPIEQWEKEINNARKSMGKKGDIKLTHFTDPKTIQEREEISKGAADLLFNLTITSNANMSGKGTLDRDIQLFFDINKPEYNKKVVRVFEQNSHSTVEERKNLYTHKLLELMDIKMEDLIKPKTDKELVEFYSKNNNLQRASMMLEGEGFYNKAKSAGVSKDILAAYLEFRTKTMGMFTADYNRIEMISFKMYAQTDLIELALHKDEIDYMRENAEHETFSGVFGEEYSEVNGALAQEYRAITDNVYLGESLNRMEKIEKIFKFAQGPSADFSNCTSSMNTDPNSRCYDAETMEYLSGSGDTIVDSMTRDRTIIIPDAKNPYKGFVLKLFKNGEVKWGELPEHAPFPGPKPQKPKLPPKPKAPGRFARFLDACAGIVNLRYIPVQEYEDELEKYNDKVEHIMEEYEEKLQEYEGRNNTFYNTISGSKEKFMEVVNNSITKDFTEIPGNENYYKLKVKLSDEKTAQYKKYYDRMIERDTFMAGVREDMEYQGYLFGVTLNSAANLSEQKMMDDIANALATMYVKNDILKKMELNEMMPIKTMEEITGKEYAEARKEELLNDLGFKEVLRDMSMDDLKGLMPDNKGINQSKLNEIMTRIDEKTVITDHYEAPSVNTEDVIDARVGELSGDPSNSKYGKDNTINELHESMLKAGALASSCANLNDKNGLYRNFAEIIAEQTFINGIRKGEFNDKTDEWLRAASSTTSMVASAKKILESPEFKLTCEKLTPEDMELFGKGGPDFDKRIDELQKSYVENLAASKNQGTVAAEVVRQKVDVVKTAPSGPVA